MQIIPVIDLINGQVVRAERGERASYRPIQSRLAFGSEPAGIVAGFLSLGQFTTVYIADLDAITNHGDNDRIIKALESRFENITFWVDAGVSERIEAENWLAQHAGHLILGSESLLGTSVLQALNHHPRVVLSLDFRADALQGPRDLDISPELWPQNVIAMTLARVGSHSGPDFARIEKLFGVKTTQRIIAAGGARDANDLKLLENAGVAGVLIASALHDGSITDSELRGRL